MTRSVITVLAALTLVGSVMGTQQLLQVTAQDNRVVPVNVVTFRPAADRESEAGAACEAPFLEATQERQPRQIVVRDETDMIVAIADVPAAGTWVPFTSDIQLDIELACNHRLEIAVPEARFYTVYLEETRLRGYAAVQLSNIEEANEVWTAVD